jgi:uncharacterized protein (TIGR04255 family)
VTASGRTLPDYGQPPVVETLLAVQFSPLTKFDIPHFGLYWAKIREDYPNYQVLPPLGQVIEQFGSERVQHPKLGLELVSRPEIRCWFIEKSGAMLTQVQKDRFIHNWRKQKPEDVYVHYDKIKPRFIEEWKRFCEFLVESDLGTPEINQCEITYVNHIEVGHGWKSYGELNKVVSFWSGASSGDFLPEPESVNIGARFVLPDKKGRLHMEMQPAIRALDAQEILQLNITARGKPESSNLEKVLEWFELGHEWIVRGFTDFTAKDMHNFWRRKI